MTSVRRGLPAFVFLLGFAFAASAAAQPAPRAAPPSPQVPAPESGPVEADPIRCWWRSSTGAVRTGETFTVLLTCAVLENEAVQIVPDETRLGSSVIAMAPFEIVGGSHPADLRTANRRFFQYEYTLRMINPDQIGKDVRLPELAIHFRVNSRLEGNAALQGRDLVYMLPSLAVRILSMVVAEATDIRDTSNESFAAIESLAFRASMLRIVAITLAVLGGLVALLSLGRLAGHARQRTPTAAHELSTGAVLRTAVSELSAVQSESEQGWTDALASRALAAARIVAGSAIDRSPGQRVVDRNAVSGAGQITRAPRRGKTTAVWSTVTAEELAYHLMRESAAAPSERRPLVEDLQTALATFTATQYAREATLDRPSLDAALSRVIDAARTLMRDHAWPKPYLRRWRVGAPEPERRT